MISKIFSIRDAAAATYMSLWTVPTTGMAIRAFGDEVSSGKSPMSAHPEDYELFEIGEFDNDTGAVVITNPRAVARATEYKESQNETTPSKQA